MPGRHINDQQVRLYMRLRADHTQITSAAKAGLSVATGRRTENDPRPPSAKRQRRAYRTRPDPLAGLWDEEVVPMLRAAPGLRPISLFDELARRHPDRVGPSFRRTLERRVAEWKALHGGDRDVMFRQVQQPGRMGLSDFTDANDLGIIVAGRPLDHRLYHFALACSGFEHVEVVLGGESFAALASGLERALRLLGGAPREHRSDSLSAAFRNLARSDAADLTRRFAALVVHFGMLPTRNNRGVAHENGAIESRHGHVRKRIAQALLLRGSNRFDDLDAYRAFVAEVVGQHNRRHAAMIEAERALLRPLPAEPAMTWDEMTVRVSSASGFMCRHVFYTVPSRLVGHRLHLRIHDDHIEAFLGGSFLLTVPRRRRPHGAGAVHVVDYHHVIAALRAKPGALANLAYRDALWPRAAYRRAWDALVEAVGAREAGRTMVALLALAHDRGVEADLAAAIDAALDAGELPDLTLLRRCFTPATTVAPQVTVILPPLAAYDRLIVVAGMTDAGLAP
ncbi:MAG TPA: IS21 family transposase [Acetobacteraceae bacterium]|nr:IS21 family transposase [Acetobacteraceae bacterium]